MVASDVGNSGDGAYHHIDLLHGVYEAPVVGEGAGDEVGTLLLEGQEHLHLLNVSHRELFSLEDIGWVPLC